MLPSALPDGRVLNWLRGEPDSYSRSWLISLCCERVKRVPDDVALGFVSAAVQSLMLACFLEWQITRGLPFQGFPSVHRDRCHTRYLKGRRFRSVNQALSAVRRNSSLLYLAGFSTSK